MIHVWCAYLPLIHPHSPLGISSASPTCPHSSLQSKKGKKKGETALSMAKNDEIRALLKAAASL